MPKKTKYRFDISMPIVVEVAEDVLERNGYDPEDPKIDWDIETIPIKIIGRNPMSGHVFLEETYDPEEWSSFQEFFEHIRRRLSELDIVKPDSELRRELESIKRRLRTALDYQNELEDLLEDAVYGTPALAVTRIRDSVGLEGRERVGVSVANRARTRLNRWSTPALKDSVRTARAIQAMPHQLRQAVLDLLG